jgi:4-amino-4-deoxy-L-arabinose transferase-like glycosyltransferase
VTTRPTDVAQPPLLTRLLEGFASLFVAGAVQDCRGALEKRLLVLLLLVAAAVRFWGVGSFGLHQPDEATTALPAIHILVDGTPRFPSGMLYTRAMAQSYLIAASVAAFGQTEWAIRLPSVLCGVLLVWLVWLLGRRFLNPLWNTVLAAVACFLPGLIADSRVARMYIFLLATLAVFAVLVFKWEQTNKKGYLLAAVAAMMAGVHFHHLAIFGSLLIFFPALVRGDRNRLAWAAMAYVPIAVYFIYMRWTPSQYPLVLTDWVTDPSTIGKAPGSFGLRFQPWVSGAVLIAAGTFSWLYAGRMATRWASRLVPALLFGGFVCIAGLYYHLGVLLLLAAAVVGRRFGKPSWRIPLLLLLVVSALAASQLWMLHANGPGTLRKSIGVLVGQPSIWQYLVIGNYSIAVLAVVAAGLALALLRLARGEPVAEHWLFFALAVWVPLFVLGLTDWDFLPRYTEFALIPLVIIALAECQQWVARWAGRWSPAIAALAAMAVINPVAVARTIGAGGNFADHRGQAAYLRSLKLQPNDIVIAEEVLYQTYYLGHLDYWLYGRNAAALYIERVNGNIVDQYAHVPLISTAAELQAIIDRTDRGAIYIIGSAEEPREVRRYLRGPELAEVLESGRLKTVFVARDGLGKIWKVEAEGSGGRNLQ